MLHASDSIFWLSLTLLAFLGVAYTLMLSLFAARGTVEVQQRLVQRQYWRDLVTIRNRIKQGKDGNQWTLATANALTTLEARRERDLRRLGSVLRVFDARSALYPPAFLLLITIGVSTATKALSAQWGYGLLASAVAMIFTSLWYLARLLGDLQLLTRLQERRLEVDLTCAQSPWTRKARNSITIKGMLERGTSLHSVQMVLFVPCDFGVMLCLEVKPCSDEPQMSDYKAVYSASFPVLRAEVPFEFCYRDISSDSPGTYRVYGRVVSEEYNSPFDHIDITVV